MSLTKKNLCLFLILSLCFSGFSQFIKREEFNSDYFNKIVLIEINKLRRNRGIDTLVSSFSAYNIFSKPNCIEVSNSGKLYHPGNKERYNNGEIRNLIIDEFKNLYGGQSVMLNNGLPKMDLNENCFRTNKDFTNYIDMATFVIDAWEKSEPHRQIQNSKYESSNLPGVFSCHSVMKEDGMVYIFVDFIKIFRVEKTMNSNLNSLIENSDKVVNFNENSFSNKNEVSSSNNIAKDAEGKIYKTVQIGSQTWMSENLNTSKFRNGDLIPEAKTDEEWQKAGKEGKPAWCYYKNDPANGVKYGKLYNWHAVSDPRGLAPNGWHIPTDYEWTKLTDYVEITKGTSARKLKAIEKMETKITYQDVGGFDEIKWVSCSNCSYWTERQRANNPCSVCRNEKGKYVKTGNYIPKRKEKREEIINTGWDGTDEFGFSVLCSGERGISGNWWSGHAVFWTSTVEANESVWWRGFGNDFDFTRQRNILGGLSVRCIKD